MHSKQQAKPLILYAKGNVSIVNHDKIVALIGTRNPDNWIYQSIKRIGYRCAEQGIPVLTGLALGCDTAALEGCLEIGGHAIGVLGNGLDTIYPKQNQSLSDLILKHGGCLISEYPPGNRINKYQLVVRDKLQAILSDSIIVGQTTESGGSMHAAKYGLETLCTPVGVLSGDKCHGESFSGNDYLFKLGAVSLKNGDDLQNFLGHSIKNKQAILFDLDQTLIDSSQLEPMRKNCNWDYVMSNLHLVKPIKGVDQYLKNIKIIGLKSGLVSSSPKNYVLAVCKKFNWDFDVVVAYQDTKNHKPNPYPLSKAASLLDVKADLCVYVGDDDKDQLAAKNARMKFIHLVATDLREDLQDYLGRRM